MSQKREFEELQGALNATLSGADSSSARAVGDYLRDSPAFNEGRVVPLAEDVEPMHEVGQRIYGLPGVDKGLNQATDQFNRSIAVQKRAMRRPNEEIQETTVRVAMMPLRNLVVGARIMEAVTARSSQLGKMEHVANAILGATTDIGTLSRWDSHRYNVKGLRPYLLGYTEDIQDDMQLILGPYLQALRLCAISDHLYESSKKFQSISQTMLRRAVVLAQQLNPEKGRKMQEQLNTMISLIDLKKAELQVGVESTTSKVVMSGTSKQDPDMLRARLEMAKQEGKKAGALAELLNKRKVSADYVRDQSLKAARVLTSKAGAIVMDDTSQLAASLAAATALLGELSIINIIGNQAAAGAAAVRVAMVYLTEGNLKSSDQLESDIEARFSGIRALMLAETAGRIPDGQNPQNIIDLQ